MLYVFDLTLPASTARADPQVDTRDFGVGLLTRIEADFPPGCKIITLASGESRPSGNQLLVGVRILLGEQQLLPINPDAWLQADAYTIQSREHQLVEGPSPKIKLVGFNEDDTYPHTVIVRLEVLPLELERQARATDGALQRLGRILFGGP